MRCAIMQPTYLPWIGYFQLLASVDLFIFLDDVQFAKRSWQQRNRIILNGKEHYLTIPVLTKGKRSQTILETQIDDSQDWRNKHANSIKHAYSKHPNGQQLLTSCNEFLHVPTANLADQNIRIIEYISQRLGYATTFRRSSELPVGGVKSDYLLKLCTYFGATTYLSAAGSKEYIEEEQIFTASDVRVEYQNYIPLEYPQKNSSTFIPYMSIIDLLANLSYEKAREYIGVVS